jgi:hypothetical protein
MAKIPVSGDLPGLLFTVGTVLIFYWGVPALRYVFPAAIALGCGIAAVLHFVHHEDPGAKGPVKFLAIGPVEKPSGN